MGDDEEKPNVLVVDDTHANLVAFEAQLANLSCTIVLADSGNSALRQLLKKKFAVVLLDVWMADMDGYEVATYMKSNFITKNIPIILVTAMSESEEVIKKGYSVGAVDFLFKPVDPYVLQSKVQVFLDLYLSNQRKQMIESLRETVKARDEFISIASHELKTPLTALQLQQQLIMRSMKDIAHGSKLMSRLEIAVRQVARLARLVNTLLDVSRLAMNKLVLDYVEFDMAETISKIVTEFDVILKAAWCKIELDIRGPVVGSWDQERVEEIVTNLLSNAAKFSPGKPIEISCHQEGDDVVINVKDHGPGIPKKDQRRIFDRFERAAPARNFGGLGLGLYISRRVAEMHGGSIELRSDKGQGAIFTVRLPLQPTKDGTED